MHGTYPTGINGLGGLAEIGGGIGATPFLYVPNLAPVGSGAAYFPGDVENDAAALVFLHFMSDVDDANRAISNGSQAADIANKAGGFDPFFRAAVSRIQAARGLKVDSFIGPQTRGGIAAAVLEANAKGLGGGPVPPLPPAVIPVDPGNRVPVAPGPLPGIQPAKTGPAAEEDDTLMYVGIGVAALAALGVAWWALK